MIRRAAIAGLAVVVLIALGWRLSILAESSALAQQPGPQAQKPAATQSAQQPTTTQPGQAATQPTQGKLVVQFGGSAAGSKPTPEELKALARATEEWVKNNPKGKTEAAEQPQVKDNKCPPIPPGEREAIGLPAPTWVARHGKVQPAVREALEAQRKLIESKDPMMEFQFDRPCGFQGMTYVDVYLRCDAKGKRDSEEDRNALGELQTRVLHRLTAAEFAMRFEFKESAGFIGWVSLSGLEKLAEDPDVVAVGLDDQARPKEAPAIEGKSRTRRSERTGNVDGEVYTAVDGSADGYTWVMVILNVPVQWEAPQDEKDAKLQQMEDNVLSALRADEFRLTDRGRGFCGYVNSAGLAKLHEHPDVWSVCLGEAMERP